MNPNNVNSPKDKWQTITVLHTEKDPQEPWSMALGRWEGKLVMAIRWDGLGDHPGNPVSRGYSTWFVVPEMIGDAMLANLPISKDKLKMVTMMFEEEAKKKAA